LIGPFFVIGPAQSDPIWPVLTPAAGEKERPDRVRPGLANERERCRYDCSFSSTLAQCPLESDASSIIWFHLIPAVCRAAQLLYQYDMMSIWPSYFVQLFLRYLDNRPISDQRFGLSTIETYSFYVINYQDICNFLLITSQIIFIVLLVRVLHLLLYSCPSLSIRVVMEQHFLSLASFVHS